MTRTQRPSREDGIIPVKQCRRLAWSYELSLDVRIAGHSIPMTPAPCTAQKSRGTFAEAGGSAKVLSAWLGSQPPK